jgi:2-keto-4-pentenoate hydratase
MQPTQSQLKDNSRNTGNSSLRRTACGSLCACLLLTACISTRERAARALFDAWRDGASAPLAHNIDETLTNESAYRVQRELVRLRLAGARPAGFKAGLTSKPSQARFHADGPIAGVLWTDPKQTPAVLQLSKLRGLNIETEVGFRIGAPIHHRLADVSEMKRHVDGIAPAIELPNLDYTKPAELTAADIVASNVAAAYFIVGEFRSPDQRDPNAAAPRLTCAGKEVNVGHARDALGDQWAAALWLVNTMVDQGWSIERGQILMTGALGRMVTAQPGQCVASYGEWGSLEITIEE